MRHKILFWTLANEDRHIEGNKTRSEAWRDNFIGEFPENPQSSAIVYHDGGDWLGYLFKLPDGREVTYILAYDGESLYEGNALNCAIEDCEGIAEHRCECGAEFCATHIKNHVHNPRKPNHVY